MPRQVAPGHQGVYIEVPLALKAVVEDLAKANQRSLMAEVVHAIQRHVEAPPVVRVITPPLPPAEVDHTPKKRGRPKKTKE